MHPLRRLSGFLVFSLVIYGLLVYPWPGVMDGYRWYFCAGANALLGSVGGAKISFKPIAAADHAKDTNVVIQIPRPPYARGQLELKCTYTGYRPTAFMIALVLATPLAWRRRLRALLWCLLWVQVFIAFRVDLRLLDAVSNADALAVFTPGPFWKGLLSGLNLVFFTAPASDYTVPAFIWLLVCFRRGDLQRVLGEQPEKELARRTPASTGSPRRSRHTVERR